MSGFYDLASLGDDASWTESTRSGFNDAPNERSQRGGFVGGNGTNGNHAAAAAPGFSRSVVSSRSLQSGERGVPPSGPSAQHEVPSAGSTAPFEDAEVLEQYKIIALLDASARLKANTGYDINARRKEDNVNNNSGPSRPPGPKPRVGEPPPPPPRRIVTEPTLAPPQRVGVRGESSTIPSLVWGDVVHNSVADGGGGNGNLLQRSASFRGVRDDEHLVRCMGCAALMKAKKVATLVGCPDCKTVSVASSTQT